MATVVILARLCLLDASGLRFDSSSRRNAGGSSTSQSHGASSGRSAFADATAAAAALPDEAAADYMQPKRPSRPASEGVMTLDSQLQQRQGQSGSLKSASSLSQGERIMQAGSMSRGRRDQVMLKVSE